MISDTATETATGPMMPEASTGVIFYPDIYSGDAGINLHGAPAVCVKSTQGDWYANPDYQTEIDHAKALNMMAFAYHFLEAGNGKGQAQWYYSKSGTKPCMVDVETNGANGTGPSLRDVVDFIDELRNIGGRIHLVYLPHWYWQDHMGSPYLGSLKSLKMSLVSSNYTGYSDNGPGWNGYGGMNPDVWQFSDHTNFGGKVVDFNAFKGSANELWSLAATGSRTVTGNPAPTDSEPTTPPVEHTATGTESLATALSGSGTSVAESVYWMAINNASGFGPAQEPYVSAGKWTDPMPKGMIFYTEK